MIVCSTSTHSVGCTFLDWSIHFLAGADKFFSVYDNQWIPLMANPLNKLNAHGHKKNHPHGTDETKKFVHTLQELSDLTSIFPAAIHMDRAAKQLGIDIDHCTADQWQQIFDLQITDYNAMLHMCNAHNVKIIFVSLDDNFVIYAKQTRSLDRMIDAPRPAKSTEEIQHRLDELFFKDSILAWQQQDMCNIWDIRERWALKTNTLKWKPITVDLKFEHYWIDAQNLWYNGQREIPKIMQWLGLDVDCNRFNSWLPIYQEWQKQQLDTLQFQYNYKHIVDCIVHNWWYPIDLTFDQEVIVQHCLIFNHGLNLKTWQLEKFPNNTQDLHKLLEPNIHPL